MNSIHEVKKHFLAIAGQLGAIEIALFVGIFVIFVLIFILGVAWRANKPARSVLFLLSFLILFSTPFVLSYLMQEKIYKIQTTYYQAKPMQYADGFLVDMDITNIGKRSIKQCIVRIEVFHNQNRWIDKLKNMLWAQESFVYHLTQKIPVHHTQHFIVMIDGYGFKHKPYKVGTSCS
ncbi:hypothetical protein BKH46_02920 [Helicobacter sp. 12S02634-8]|uniref:DUF2393 family protein n=1 Tax=Helicobacter sp. 12S02634-8 TaxID=1476199 RepID=UPI000BA66BE7|nr:DUF2393 family protein [Helicobacter sp. 12S02634-8]PAF47801.1 hypothetical protein BKH46_02920 [Helicobacter sp. 12S02634-8]